MPLFSPEQVQKILSQLVGHFHDTYPKEAVGVILKDGSVMRFRNWSSDPDRFLVLPVSLIWSLGWSAYWRGTGIQAVYHSHRQGTSPSETDQVFMQRSARVWPHVNHLIFNPDGSFQTWELPR